MRCARPGSPAGGPKDEAPPEVVQEIPPNRSVFFNANKATISFNEFIQLKDPSKEIFISPPMRTKPLFKVQGKKVVIEFQEELKENTTYTVNFGNAVVDFTEGNPLVNFEYVFSTGDHLDSLSIPGQILNAFNHKPEEAIVVMVYQDDNDTIPLDSLPFRIPPKSASKTTEDGIFRINNLSAGEYKLFALEDLNNNYIFDIPNERIAFLDSLITISPVEVIGVSADSTDTTEVAVPGLRLLTENTYTLYLFEEVDSVQRLLSKKLYGKSLLQYIFRQPADPVTITPVGFQPDRPDWYILEYNQLKDTVNFWLRPGLPDTIRVCVAAGDSLVDTTRYILSRQAPERLVKRREEVTEGMRIFPNVLAGALDLNKNLTLQFAIPVQDFNPGKLTLFTPADTISPPFTFSDSIRRKGEVGYKFLPDEYYQLVIEDSAFSDLSGSYNDSTSVKFKVRTMEAYGILIMNITLPDTSSQYILQLMTDKEEIIIQQKTITRPGLVRFEYLMPGNLKLKAVFDANSNGRWDTGKYSINSLPERVEYYSPALSIRANWDLQEEWKLE